MVAVCALCLGITLLTLKVIGTPRRIKVAEVKHVPADLINYVIPYIVSLMGLDYGSPTRLLGFAVLFLWIFWITYRSGQIAMNPVLIVFEWRLFELKYSYLQSDGPWVGRAGALPGGSASKQELLSGQPAGRDGPAGDGAGKDGWLILPI